jgi:peroxiredoxin
MRELQKLRPHLERAEIDLIGVSLDFGGPERVRDFLEKNEIRYPILIALEESMPRVVKGDEMSVPFSLLLDEDGTLLEAFSGWSRETHAALEALTGQP